MVSINEVYDLIFDYANKNQGGGYLDPNQFNRFANIINIGLLDDDFKAFQSTQELTDRSKPFLIKGKFQIPKNGQLPYPSDYYYFIDLGTYDRDMYSETAAMCKTKGVPPDYSKLIEIPVEILDNDKRRVRNLAPQYRASYDFPFATLYDGFIYVEPIDLGVAALDYLKQPNPVKWAFTIDPATQLPIYDPANSIDFEWTDNSKNEIIGRIAEAFGIEVREYDFSKAMGGLNG